MDTFTAKLKNLKVGPLETCEVRLDVGVASDLPFRLPEHAWDLCADGELAKAECRCDAQSYDITLNDLEGTVCALAEAKAGRVVLTSKDAGDEIEVSASVLVTARWTDEALLWVARHIGAEVGVQMAPRQGELDLEARRSDAKKLIETHGPEAVERALNLVKRHGAKKVHEALDIVQGK